MAWVAERGCGNGGYDRCGGASRDGGRSDRGAAASDGGGFVVEVVEKEGLETRSQEGHMVSVVGGVICM